MLLIDMNNLCMREAFARFGLSHRGKPSGVIYGTLQQLKILLGKFPTHEVCCCWDSPRATSLRKQFYPAYKAYRDNREPSQESQEAGPQMKWLRESILPRLGLPNQMIQEGYEADDLIASLCLQAPRMVNNIIVSSDNDLWQLIGPRTTIWDIGKKVKMDWMSLVSMHGVCPMQWIQVKAIAGDRSDDIDGVPGVGIKTAVKYLGDRAARAITERINDYIDNGIIARNKKLVRLPWPGCSPGEIRTSKFDPEEFLRVCSEWGIRGLR